MNHQIACNIFEDHFCKKNGISRHKFSSTFTVYESTKRAVNLVFAITKL